MRATEGQDSVRYDVVVVGGEDTHHAVAAHRARRKAQAAEGR